MTNPPQGSLDSLDVTNGSFYICLECGYKYRGSSFYDGEVHAPCEKCGHTVKERYNPQILQLITRSQIAELNMAEEVISLTDRLALRYIKERRAELEALLDKENK